MKTPVSKRWPELPAPLPKERMPRHVAIIMDGNGRWATRQGLIRVNGHQAGVDAVRDITQYCGQTGIAALTLYAFSTENWKRPKAEVKFLFRLLKKYLVEEREELSANSVRLRTLGNSAALADDVRAELQRTMELTADGTGLQLNLALNYGAQDEILRAAAHADSGDPAAFENRLDTAGLPPVDLLIRTAGEQRLSNFLLWQCEGAEFYAENACWPEFRRTHLETAIREFDARRLSATH